MSTASGPVGEGMTERYLQAFRSVYEATGSYEAASAAADAWLESAGTAIARRAAWAARRGQHAQRTPSVPWWAGPLAASREHPS